MAYSFHDLRPMPLEATPPPEDKDTTLELTLEYEHGDTEGGSGSKLSHTASKRVSSTGLTPNLGVSLGIRVLFPDFET